MTRLAQNDIIDLTNKLTSYDTLLKNLCGHSLKEIAQVASYKEHIGYTPKIAVIPITTGLGLIGGFCNTVADIIRFLGFDATVTQQSDIAGIAQSVYEKYDIMFLADDNTFISVNFAKQLTSDNSEATGRGFATALSLVKGSNKKVLLLGAGPVGTSAAKVLLNKGAKITLYDIDKNKSNHFKTNFPDTKIAEDLNIALLEHDFIYDATPAGSFITKDMLNKNAIIVAPGVPRCLDEECNEYMEGNVIHDVLELGVATMLFDVL